MWGLGHLYYETGAFMVHTGKCAIEAFFFFFSAKIKRTPAILQKTEIKDNLCALKLSARPLYLRLRSILSSHFPVMSQ